jgi:hypothetical protein
MLRLIVTKTDATHAANVGGEVERNSSTHLVDCPDLEKALKESGGYVSVSLTYEFIDIRI